MVATILLNTKYKNGNSPSYSDDDTYYFPKDNNSNLQNSENTTSMPKTQVTSTTLTKCTVCNTEKPLITDPVYGKIVCSRCGAVISERIEETGQEWRNFFAQQEEAITK
jgi:hypothetical protein